MGAAVHGLADQPVIKPDEIEFEVREKGNRMSFQIKMKPMLAVGLVCLLGFLITVNEVKAETGSGESPFFSLNTAWASGAQNNSGVPQVDRLGGCYPNPFNPLTMINFELANTTMVELRIYDLQGRLVKVLVDSEPMVAGSHEMAWDGRDTRGGGVAAGVYLYRLVTESYSGSRRMTLVK